MTSRFVVVGAGLTGAATAWQLARRGHEVTVLERTAPANAQGSSHGSARIFRYAYPDPMYAQLVVDARLEWDELEAGAGRQLITVTGALDFGKTRDPTTLATVLEKVGVECELLTREAAARRWPQIVFDTDVLWHPSGGVLDAESTVLTLLEQARAAGAIVETDWPVSAVVRAGAGYRVLCADGRSVDAARVVVAAGGWLPDLLGTLALPEAFARAFPALQVMQEYAYHFPYRDDGEAWPTFVHKAPSMQAYSLPGGRDAALPDGRTGQKLAEYNGGTPIPTAAAQTGVMDPANRERVLDYVRRTLPGLVPEPYAETTCLFTNTPNGDFVIDGTDGITIASPCSGHGGKFAPLIGRIAADVADGSAPAPRELRVGRR